MGGGLDARIDLTEAEGVAAYRVTGGARNHDPGHLPHS
jgi:hypothetical protein